MAKSEKKRAIGTERRKDRDRAASHEEAGQAQQALPGSDVEAARFEVAAAARDTEDFALLNAVGPHWLQDNIRHTDTWRVFRIMAEFVHSFDVMAKVGPAVAVFGSARLNESSPYYKAAVEVGEKLAHSGWAVITGGGPGIMEAANRGAHTVGRDTHSRYVSIGLNIELPFEQETNSFVDTCLNFRYFFCRKTNFVKYSSGFVVFPGGFGTMDELFDSLTLVQTHKIQNFPIVLYGSDYWAGLIDWMRSTMLPHDTILGDDLGLLHLCDDPDEAVDWIFKHTQNLRHPATNGIISPPPPSATSPSSKAGSHRKGSKKKSASTQK